MDGLEVDAHYRAGEEAVHDLGQAVDEASALDDLGEADRVEAAADENGDHPARQSVGLSIGVVGAEAVEKRVAQTVTDSTRPAGHRLVVPARCLKGGEHRRVGLMKGGELFQPGGQGRDPLLIRGDVTEPVAKSDHLFAELRCEVPEDVVFAGEVLVEGRARAAGLPSDQLDPSPMEADLGKYRERAGEDAPLCVAASLPDVGVVPEGRAPADARTIHPRQATHAVLTLHRAAPTIRRLI